MGALSRSTLWWVAGSKLLGRASAEDLVPVSLGRLDFAQHPADTLSDTVISSGVPPKSPDYIDVNTVHIVTQTHLEAHSLKTSGDVWHYRHPPERPVNELAPPQRSDTGADIPLHT